MDHRALKEEIQTLIAANKIEEAIERLASAQFSALDKELIILNSQYNRVKEEMRLNLITKDEGERRMNGITMALINLSDKIDAKPSALSGKVLGVRFSTGQMILLIAVPVLLIAGLIYWNSQTGKADKSTTSAEQGGIDTQGTPPADSSTISLEELTAQQLAWVKKLPVQPVAAYFFNGNTKDAIGYRNAKFCSAKLTEDRAGQQNGAYKFDGENAHIRLPKILDESSVNFSISCWINSEQASGSVFGQYTGKTEGEALEAANHYLALKNGFLQFDEIPATNNNLTEPIRSPSQFKLDKWTHVVYVRAGGISTWYINGEKTQQVGQDYLRKFYKVPGNEVSYAVVGARPVGSYYAGVFKEDDSFEGCIDDLLVFKESITDETVQQIFSKK